MTDNGTENKSVGRTMDLLHGKIWPKFLQFAIPLALTGILQQLFNSADIAVLGQFVGKNAMAAVGSNSPIISLFVNFFVGLSIGANVVISNLTGRGSDHYDKANRAVHTAIMMALISGVCMTVIGLIVAKGLLELTGVPAEVERQAVLYLRIYVCGMPFILLYNFESAIFRSQGDTRTPLIALVIAGVTNVVLNLFFVLVVGMDVDGVATATVISNVISSGMLFRELSKSSGILKVEIRKLRIDGKLLRTILKIGVPSGLQSMLFSISNIIIQSAVNSLGATVMAGSAAAFNIEIISYFVLNSFTQTFVTFIGQNYGAGNYSRCHSIVRQGLIMDILFTMTVGLTMLHFAHPLLSIFNGDPQVIAAGTTRLKYILTAQVINLIIDALSGILRGLGWSTVPAAISFVGICGVRIAWVYTVFARTHTFRTLLMAYPVSWVCTAVVLVIAYFAVTKKVMPKNGTGGQNSMMA